MMPNRYAVWIAVWEHFQAMNVRKEVPKEKWDELYELLDRLWQDERKDAKPEELAAHAGAHSTLNSDFSQFWRECSPISLQPRLGGGEGGIQLDTFRSHPHEH
jgi:hypothetical protein